MAYLKLYKADAFLKGEVSIAGSKSESNRLLILKALFPDSIFIENLSTSVDTCVLQSALSTEGTLDVHHAGTAMRFLTAYCAAQLNKVFIIKGSKRMHERPIATLVKALRKLSAKIDYLENEGYPPLRIYGKQIIGGSLSIEADVSSQYISALMLTGAIFKEGLHLKLSKKITSAPYISMTLELLRKVGISVLWKDREIFIEPLTTTPSKTKFFVESDWSSASYYYSLVAFSEKSDIHLNVYKRKSLQGDRALKNIYKRYFGVQTVFKKHGIHLSKDPLQTLPAYFECDLNQCPDIAQTIAVTCAGLKIRCLLKGLETLKIKETDRLRALQNELIKIGVRTCITENSLEILRFEEVSDIPLIYTYHDHRMAMAFAPLALYRPLVIQDPKVVEKSYPNFWRDLKSLGFCLENYTI
ncbi:3-phosphoshikimate 1-carboxyvinyltransferase [Bacteroidetes bacterium endosymbiont of Geopemphigus sp.]|uniref:3-phosphoshikimate 1-carboxyvinyltransferase n=1 Tax=Bacteroidetes bacterium endosymbiont of Geopemphigus sp. TaxID=2047937 RepID=UPI000CD14489|nr:3-phosphoshikimate 1-carboxyvinyltransferase [Bacteroidetes bacterium endosymbiont of Geopemphigus sp.]